MIRPAAALPIEIQHSDDPLSAEACELVAGLLLDLVEDDAASGEEVSP